MADSAKPEDWHKLLADEYAARRAARRDPPHPITCRGRRDGGGAQALAVLSALLWAEATGCCYFHTPFANVGHAIGSREAWAATWETFLNFGMGEAPPPDDARIVPVDDYLRDPAAYAKPGIVLAARQFHWRPFQTRPALRRARTVLRAKYHGSDKTAFKLHRGAPNALVVAVHIRRGDVTADHPRFRHYFTQDAPILTTIQSVRAVAREIGRTVEINVFSEGPPDMFGAFAAADCRLHLDGDALEAFHNLVSADILIQAKSSFSYVAGLISSGAVLHEPYVGGRGRPLYRHAPGWILRDAAGSFEAAKLRRALARRWYHRPLRRLRSWLLRT